MHLATFNSSTALARKLDALRPPPRPSFRVAQRPVDKRPDDEKRAWKEWKVLICDRYGAKRDVFCKIRWLMLGKKLAAIMGATPGLLLAGEKRWTSREIIEEIAFKHDLRVEDLICAGRLRPLVLARQEACYEIARLTQLSLPQIGRALGNRDHTTILHGIRRHIERTGAPSVRGLHAEHARGT